MLGITRFITAVLLVSVMMPAQAHGRGDFAAGVATALIVGPMLYQQPSPVVGVTIGGPGFYYQHRPMVVLPPSPPPVVCDQVYDHRMGQWVMMNCRETVHFRAPRPIYRQR